MKRSSSSKRIVKSASTTSAGSSAGRKVSPTTALKREITRLEIQLESSAGDDRAKLEVQINQKRNLLKKARQDLAERKAARAGSAVRSAARGGVKRAPMRRKKKPAGPPPHKPSTAVGSEAQLMETLQLVETLQRTIYDSESRRKKAERQVKELKQELESVGSAMEATMEASKRDLLFQISQLQEAVTKYKDRYDEVKREQDARVSYLEKALAAAQGGVAGAEAKAYEGKIEALQEDLLTYMGRCDDLKKQLNEANRAAKVRRGKSPQVSKLTEEVQNLSFQVYYGQTLKDQEIDDLRAEVQRLKVAAGEDEEGDEDDEDSHEDDDDIDEDEEEDEDYLDDAHDAQEP